MSTAIAETRVCCNCGDEQPIEQFRIGSKATGKRAYDCNRCHRESVGRSRKNQRRKVLRRYVKVAQFAKLDRKLRALTGAVIRKLGGVDRVARLWATLAKEALGSGRRDRFAMNFFSTAMRLLEYVEMNKARERAAQPQNERREWAEVSDEQMEQQLQKRIDRIIKAQPEMAIAAAARLGWTVIPPVNHSTET